MNLVMGSPQGFISEAGSVAFFEMPPNKINFGLKNLACVRGMRTMHRAEGMPRYQGMLYILILECLWL